MVLLGLPVSTQAKPCCEGWSCKALVMLQSCMLVAEPPKVSLELVQQGKRL